jgi:hypothetical protein
MKEFKEIKDAKSILASLTPLNSFIPNSKDSEIAATIRNPQSEIHNPKSTIRNRIIVLQF